MTPFPLYLIASLFSARAGRRALCLGLAVIYAHTNVLAAHAESNFWEERKTFQDKTHPDNAGSPALLAQLPTAAQVDWQPTLRGEPAALPSSQVPAGPLGWVASLVLPYGSVGDVYISPRIDAPLVIHVQDAHHIEEAQRNISAIIEGLKNERNISLVGLEGAQGAFALEPYRTLPDAAITRSIADHFLREGYLTGAEYAGLTAEKPPLLWGVENQDLYDENIDAFTKSLALKSGLETLLTRMDSAADALAGKTFSLELRELDRRVAAFHRSTEGLSEYVPYLLELKPVASRNFPNLRLLVDALHWEESLDFKQVEAQRAALVKRLADKLDEEQLSSFVQQSLLHKQGRLGYGQYYRLLDKLCRSQKLPLENFPEFENYTRYVLLAEQIDRNKLFDEISSLENLAQDALATDPAQRSLLVLRRQLLLLEKIVRHGMTPMDWAAYQKQMEEIHRLPQSLLDKVAQAGLPHRFEAPQDFIARLSPFEDFCRLALARNQALVENLLAKMKRENARAAVLVSGGFHTEGLTQMWRQRAVSYVVVTPRLKTVPSDNPGLEALSREPLPLEKLFSGETVYLVPPLILAARVSLEDLRKAAFNGMFATLSAALYHAREQGRRNRAPPEKLVEEVENALRRIPGLAGFDAELKTAKRGWLVNVAIQAFDKMIRCQVFVAESQKFEAAIAANKSILGSKAMGTYEISIDDGQGPAKYKVSIHPASSASAAILEARQWLLKLSSRPYKLFFSPAPLRVFVDRALKETSRSLFNMRQFYSAGILKGAPILVIPPLMALLILLNTVTAVLAHEGHRHPSPPRFVEKVLEWPPKNQPSDSHSFNEAAPVARASQEPAEPSGPLETRRELSDATRRSQIYRERYGRALFELADEMFPLSEKARAWMEKRLRIIVVDPTINALGLAATPGSIMSDLNPTTAWHEEGHQKRSDPEMTGQSSDDPRLFAYGRNIDQALERFMVSEAEKPLLERHPLWHFLESRRDIPDGTRPYHFHLFEAEGWSALIVGNPHLLPEELRPFYGDMFDPQRKAALHFDSWNDLFEWWFDVNYNQGEDRRIFNFLFEDFGNIYVAQPQAVRDQIRAPATLRRLPESIKEKAVALERLSLQRFVENLEELGPNDASRVTQWVWDKMLVLDNAHPDVLRDESVYPPGSTGAALAATFDEARRFKKAEMNDDGPDRYAARRLVRLLGTPFGRWIGGSLKPKQPLLDAAHWDLISPEFRSLIHFELERNPEALNHPRLPLLIESLNQALESLSLTEEFKLGYPAFMVRLRVEDGRLEAFVRRSAHPLLFDHDALWFGFDGAFNPVKLRQYIHMQLSSTNYALFWLKTHAAATGQEIHKKDGIAMLEKEARELSPDQDAVPLLEKINQLDGAIQETAPWNHVKIRGILNGLLEPFLEKGEGKPKYWSYPLASQGMHILSVSIGPDQRIFLADTSRGTVKSVAALRSRYDHEDTGVKRLRKLITDINAQNPKTARELAALMSTVQEPLEDQADRLKNEGYSIWNDPAAQSPEAKSSQLVIDVLFDSVDKKGGADNLVGIINELPRVDRRGDSWLLMVDYLNRRGATALARVRSLSRMGGLKAEARRYLESAIEAHIFYQKAVKETDSAKAAELWLEALEPKDKGQNNPLMAAAFLLALKQGPSEMDQVADHLMKQWPKGLLMHAFMQRALGPERLLRALIEPESDHEAIREALASVGTFGDHDNSRAYQATVEAMARERLQSARPRKMREAYTLLTWSRIPLDFLLPTENAKDARERAGTLRLAVEFFSDDIEGTANLLTHVGNSAENIERLYALDPMTAVRVLDELEMLSRTDDTKKAELLAVHSAFVVDPSMSGDRLAQREKFLRHLATRRGVADRVHEWLIRHLARLKPQEGRRLLETLGKGRERLEFLAGASSYLPPLRRTDNKAVVKTIETVETRIQGNIPDNRGAARARPGALFGWLSQKFFGKDSLAHKTYVLLLAPWSETVLLEALLRLAPSLSAAFGWDAAWILVPLVSALFSAAHLDLIFDKNLSRQERPGLFAQRFVGGLLLTLPFVLLPDAGFFLSWLIHTAWNTAVEAPWPWVRRLGLRSLGILANDGRPEDGLGKQGELYAGELGNALNQVERSLAVWDQGENPDFSWQRQRLAKLLNIDRQQRALILAEALVDSLKRQRTSPTAYRDFLWQLLKEEGETHFMTVATTLYRGVLRNQRQHLLQENQWALEGLVRFLNDNPEAAQRHLPQIWAMMRVDLNDILGQRPWVDSKGINNNFNPDIFERQAVYPHRLYFKDDSYQSLFTNLQLRDYRSVWERKRLLALHQAAYFNHGALHRLFGELKDIDTDHLIERWLMDFVEDPKVNIEARIWAAIWANEGTGMSVRLLNVSGTLLQGAPRQALRFSIVKILADLRNYILTPGEYETFFNVLSRHLEILKWDILGAGIALKRDGLGRQGLENHTGLMQEMEWCVQALADMALEADKHGYDVAESAQKYLIKITEERYGDPDIASEVISSLNGAVHAGTYRVINQFLAHLDPDLSPTERQAWRHSVFRPAQPPSDIVDFIKRTVGREKIRTALLIIMRHKDNRELLKQIIFDDGLSGPLRLYAFSWYAAQFLKPGRKADGGSPKDDFDDAIFNEMMEVVKPLAGQYIESRKTNHAAVLAMIDNPWLRDEEAKISAIAALIDSNGTDLNWDDRVFIRNAMYIARTRGRNYWHNANSEFVLGWPFIQNSREPASFLFQVIIHELGHRFAHDQHGFSNHVLRDSVIHEFLADLLSFSFSARHGLNTGAYRADMAYSREIKFAAGDNYHTIESHEGARATLFILQSALNQLDHALNLTALFHSGLDVATLLKPDHSLRDAFRWILMAYLGEDVATLSGFQRTKDARQESWFLAYDMPDELLRAPILSPLDVGTIFMLFETDTSDGPFRINRLPVSLNAASDATFQARSGFPGPMDKRPASSLPPSASLPPAGTLGWVEGIAKFVENEAGLVSARDLQRLRMIARNVAARGFTVKEASYHVTRHSEVLDRFLPTGQLQPAGEGTVLWVSKPYLDDATDPKPKVSQTDRAAPASLRMLRGFLPGFKRVPVHGHAVKVAVAADIDLAALETRGQVQESELTETDTARRTTAAWYGLTSAVQLPKRLLVVVEKDQNVRMVARSIEDFLLRMPETERPIIEFMSVGDFHKEFEDLVFAEQLLSLVTDRLARRKEFTALLERHGGLPPAGRERMLSLYQKALSEMEGEQLASQADILSGAKPAGKRETSMASNQLLSMLEEMTVFLNKPSADRNLELSRMRSAILDSPGQRSARDHKTLLADLYASLAGRTEPSAPVGARQLNAQDWWTAVAHMYEFHPEIRTGLLSMIVRGEVEAVPPAPRPTMGRRTSDVALPVYKNLRFISLHTTAWKTNDVSTGKTWYVKVDDARAIRDENMGYALAKLCAVNVPPHGLLPFSFGELPDDIRRPWQEVIGRKAKGGEERVPTWSAMTRALVSRDINQLAGDELPPFDGDGFARVIAFAAFARHTDLDDTDMMDNMARVRVDGKDRFVLFDLREASGLNTDEKYAYSLSLAQNVYAMDPRELVRAVAHIQKIPSDDFLALAKRNGMKAADAKSYAEMMRRRQFDLPLTIAESLAAWPVKGQDPRARLAAHVEALKAAADASQINALDGIVAGLRSSPKSSGRSQSNPITRRGFLGAILGTGLATLMQRRMVRAETALIPSEGTVARPAQTAGETRALQTTSLTAGDNVDLAAGQEMMKALRAVLGITPGGSGDQLLSHYESRIRWDTALKGGTFNPLGEITIFALDLYLLLSELGHAKMALPASMDWLGAGDHTNKLRRAQLRQQIDALMAVPPELCEPGDPMLPLKWHLWKLKQQPDPDNNAQGYHYHSAEMHLWFEWTLGNPELAPEGLRGFIADAVSRDLSPLPKFSTWDDLLLWYIRLNAEDRRHVNNFSRLHQVWLSQPDAYRRTMLRRAADMERMSLPGPVREAMQQLEQTSLKLFVEKMSSPGFQAAEVQPYVWLKLAEGDLRWPAIFAGIPIQDTLTRARELNRFPAPFSRAEWNARYQALLASPYGVEVASALWPEGPGQAKPVEESPQAWLNWASKRLNKLEFQAKAHGLLIDNPLPIGFQFTEPIPGRIAYWRDNLRWETREQAEAAFEQIESDIDATSPVIKVGEALSEQLLQSGAINPAERRSLNFATQWFPEANVFGLAAYLLPRKWNSVVKSHDYSVQIISTEDNATGNPASLLDDVAADRWGRDSVFYGFYTLILTNWELVMGLPVINALNQNYLARKGWVSQVPFVWSVTLLSAGLSLSFVLAGWTVPALLIWALGSAYVFAMAHPNRTWAEKAPLFIWGTLMHAALTAPVIFLAAGTPLNIGFGPVDTLAEIWSYSLGGYGIMHLTYNLWDLMEGNDRARARSRRRLETLLARQRQNLSVDSEGSMARPDLRVDPEKAARELNTRIFFGGMAPGANLDDAAALLRSLSPQDLRDLHVRFRYIQTEKEIHILLRELHDLRDRSQTGFASFVKVLNSPSGQTMPISMRQTAARGSGASMGELHGLLGGLVYPEEREGFWKEYRENVRWLSWISPGRDKELVGIFMAHYHLARWFAQKAVVSQTATLKVNENDVPLFHIPGMQGINPGGRTVPHAEALALAVRLVRKMPEKSGRTAIVVTPPEIRTAVRKALSKTGARIFFVDEKIQPYGYDINDVLKGLKPQIREALESSLRRRASHLRLYSPLATQWRLDGAWADWQGAVSIVHILGEIALEVPLDLLRQDLDRDLLAQIMA